MKYLGFLTILLLSFVSCHSQKKERISGYVTEDNLISGDDKEKVKRQIEENAVFTSVTEIASFPNGTKALLNFFKKNYKTPPEIMSKDISGKIFLSFVVEKDGSLSDYKIIRDLGYKSGEEAIRTFQNSPRWLPAKYGDIYVRSLYTIPLSVNEKNK